jgi:hypothetical protein
MRVVTPAIKLDVEIEQADVREGRLVLTGLAGILPCETSLTAPEARALLMKVLRPRVLLWVLGRSAPAATPK